MRLAEINRILEAAERRVEVLQAAKAEALGRSFVCCTDNVHGTGCGRRSQIRTIVYIQTYWHVPPRGCIEGDYWKQGEGNFNCPKCDHRNRLYDRPEIEKLKRYFKSIEQVFD